MLAPVIRYLRSVFSHFDRRLWLFAAGSNGGAIDDSGRALAGLDRRQPVGTLVLLRVNGSW